MSVRERQRKGHTKLNYFANKRITNRERFVILNNKYE